MPKPKTTDMPATTDQATIDSLSLDELRERAEQALHHLREARRLLPGLVRMLDSERKHTDGRLRDGEGQKLGVVLDLADEHPAYVKPLADKDEGRDPSRFETSLLRDRFVRRDLLAPVAAEAGRLQGELDDTTLRLGEQSRPVTLAAYEIFKVVSKHDGAIRSRLAEVIDFYGRPARQGAVTRARNKNGDGGAGGTEQQKPAQSKDE